MGSDREAEYVMALRLEYRSAAHLLEDWQTWVARGTTFVRTEQPLPVGTILRLKLNFPGLVMPLVLSGMVVGARRDAGALGVDVELQFPNAADRDRIADLIRRAAQGDPELCGAQVRLLVVEDNPHVSKLIAEGLREAAKRDFGGRVAFDFEVAADGIEALARLRGGRFDLVITDVYLPNLDGPQLIREVRGHGPAVPILAVSAGGAAARELATKAGCTMYLDKPLRLAELINAIRTLLSL
jgi:CheY-like chemotaxis protein